MTSENWWTGRRTLGQALIILGSIGLAAMVLLQFLDAMGASSLGFTNWRPSLYAYLAWAICLGAGQILIRGEAGHMRHSGSCAAHRTANGE